jgi:hypothetical protein
MSNLPPEDDVATRPVPASYTEQEAMASRRTAPREILLLLMLLLILLLIAVATGRGMLIRFSGSNAPNTIASPVPSRIPSGQGNTQLPNRDQLADAGRPDPGAKPAVCSPPGAAQQVSLTFRDYYQQYGGIDTFGRPISQELLVNGRPIQWFERARLEYWPQNAPGYTIQGGLIGVLFTSKITFPKPAPFVSRPGARYFTETGHSLSEPFLSFWEQHDFAVFGYPISEVLLERLPQDGPQETHRVQYFERARLEYYPEQDERPVQIGLLGSALCLANSQPNITSLIQPTPVPQT